MSDVKLQAARQLIQEKNYSAARSILEAMPNDPTAQKWLRKLDQVAPSVTSKTHLIVEAALKKKAAKKRRRNWIVALVIIAALIIAILFVARQIQVQMQSRAGNSMRCDARTWWNQARPIVVEFLDTAEVAAATPRASLSPIILELQRLKRAYDEVDDPECIRQMWLDFSVGMELGINGLTWFMQQQETSSSAGINGASQAFYEAYLLSRNYGVLVDTRLSNMSLIWGGAPPSDAVATQFAATMQAQDADAGS